MFQPYLFSGDIFSVNFTFIDTLCMVLNWLLKHLRSPAENPNAAARKKRNSDNVILNVITRQKS